MLEDFYEKIEVWRDLGTDDDDDRGNFYTDLSSVEYSHDIIGNLQENSGSIFEHNNRATLNYDVLLFCDIGTEILVGDYLKFSTVFYKVEYIPPQTMLEDDHLEVGVIFDDRM